MKWFKHETQDRNTLTAKLIRSKYGAEGYGVFLTLIEIVAENVDGDPKTWGMVDKRHTLETLAVECGVDEKWLKSFLIYCNEKNIFQKKNGCLYFPNIKSRLDNWTERLQRNSVATTEQVKSYYGKKEKEKEKEKQTLYKPNLKRIAELKEKAHELIGQPLVN